MRDQKFINLAQKLCKLSEHSYKMAAIVTKGSRILSFGINKYRTHPKQINPFTKERGVSVHAELAAIIGVSEENLRGSSVYIARRLVNGEAALAKPCTCCIAILREAGVKKVIYTINNEEFYKEKV